MEFSKWCLPLMGVIFVTVGIFKIRSSIRVRKTGSSLVFGKYTNKVSINTGKAAKNDADFALIFGIFLIIFGIGFPLAFLLFR
jgi:hypothetical protein